MSNTIDGKTKRNEQWNVHYFNSDFSVTAVMACSRMMMHTFGCVRQLFLLAFIDFYSGNKPTLF